MALRQHGYQFHAQLAHSQTLLVRCCSSAYPPCVVHTGLGAAVRQRAAAGRAHVCRRRRRRRQPIGAGHDAFGHDCRPVRTVWYEIESK